MEFKAWLSGLAKYIFLKKALKSIGKNTFIAMGVDIRGKNVTIGNHTVINGRVTLDGRGGELIIGDNVDIGQETNIWTAQHDPHSDYHDTKGGNVIIEDYVWIATRVTILPGIRIGRGAVIAANSVVTKDVKEMEIAAGIPAKVIGLRTSKLKYNLTYRPWFQ